MKYREIIKLIKEDGWYLHRSKGSHHVFKHMSKAGIVVIAIHRLADDIPKGTESSILKQAGLKD